MAKRVKRKPRMLEQIERRHDQEPEHGEEYERHLEQSESATSTLSTLSTITPTITTNNKNLNASTTTTSAQNGTYTSRNCGKLISKSEQQKFKLERLEFSQESTDEDDNSLAGSNDEESELNSALTPDNATNLSTVDDHTTRGTTKNDNSNSKSSVPDIFSPNSYASTSSTSSSSPSPSPSPYTTKRVHSRTSSPAMHNLQQPLPQYVYVPSSPPPTSSSTFSPVDMPIWSAETTSALMSAIATNSVQSPATTEAISQLNITSPPYTYYQPSPSPSNGTQNNGSNAASPRTRPLRKYEFTAKSWHTLNTECLLSTTDAIDACCRTVVKTSAYFAQDSSISVEARRLALTIAVFERSVYAYAVLINYATQQQNSPRNTQPSLSTPIHNSATTSFSAILPSMTSSLNNSIQSVKFNSTSSKSWHQPAGMTCLLKLLTQQLVETSTVLKELNQQFVSFPAYCKAFFRTYIIRNVKSVISSPRKLGIYSLTFFLLLRIGQIKNFLPPSVINKMVLRFHNIVAALRSQSIGLGYSIQRYFGSPIIQTLLSFLPPFIVKCFSYLSLILSPAVLSRILSSLLTIRSSIVTCFFMLYFSYKWRIFRCVRKLRKLHYRLGFLLRLWNMCYSLIDQPQARRAVVSENDLHQVPISRWMLELVPPELEASFWDSSSYRLSFVRYVLNTLYCSVNAWYNVCGPRLIGAPFLVVFMMYYGIQPSKTARRASRLLAVPDVHMIRKAWHLLDTKLASVLTLTVLPRLGFSPGFVVCKEIELHDDEENADDNDGNLRRRLNQHMRCISENEVEPDPALRILVCSAQPLHLSFNYRFHRISSHSDVTEESVVTSESPVILYCHSGGWITDFTASHLYFLQVWAERTKIPIIYVRYSLAPENAYPAALNEIYEVYKRIVSGRIGFRASKIFITGDSTGGNLAAACCMRAIMDKIRVPDRIVLAYPILNLRSAPTPSRALYMSDAVLPMNLLMKCRALYAPSHCDADNDPCLSPIVASDALLSQWPTTCLMAGSFDPFVDDIVDFGHRLIENGVEVRLKIFDSLPHSFFDFAPVVPKAAKAVQLAADWLSYELDQ